MALSLTESCTNDPAAAKEDGKFGFGKVPTRPDRQPTKSDLEI